VTPKVNKVDCQRSAVIRNKKRPSTVFIPVIWIHDHGSPDTEPRFSKKFGKTVKTCLVSLAWWAFFLIGMVGFFSHFCDVVAWVAMIAQEI
jgi:hypothetical protein